MSGAPKISHESGHSSSLKYPHEMQVLVTKRKNGYKKFLTCQSKIECTVVRRKMLGH